MLKFYENGVFKATYIEAYTASNMKLFAEKMIYPPVRTEQINHLHQKIRDQSVRSSLILIAPTADGPFQAVADQEYSSSASFYYVNTTQLVTDGNKDDLLQFLQMLGFSNEELSSFDASTFRFIVSSSHSATCNIRYPISLSSPGHTTQTLSHWVRTAQYEFTPELNSRLNNALRQEGTRAVFAVLASKEGAASETFIREFRELALKWTGVHAPVESEEEVDVPFYFSFVDSQTLPFFTSHFHISTHNYPVIFVHDFATQFVPYFFCSSFHLRFNSFSSLHSSTYRETFIDSSVKHWTISRIDEFLNAINDGKIPPYTPPPETNNGDTSVSLPNRYDLRQFVQTHQRQILLSSVIFLGCLAVAIIVILILSPSRPEDKEPSDSSEKKKE